MDGLLPKVNGHYSQGQEWEIGLRAWAVMPIFTVKSQNRLAIQKSERSFDLLTRVWCRCRLSHLTHREHIHAEHTRKEGIIQTFRTYSHFKTP